MLGLPWPAWGETDVLLAMARRTGEAGLCPCGCGYDAAVSTDRALDDRWQVTVDTCYARAALDTYHEKHEGDLPKGALMGVRLLADGEEHVDPLQQSLESDRDEYARLRAKMRAV